MNILYTAEALATGGGRNGHARTSDGRLDLDLATPKEMGGSGDGTNPEQLFATGYAACFLSALQSVLQSVARQEKADLGETSVGALVGIGRLETGGFGLQVTLEVTVPDLPHDQALALVEKAHQVCPYSNATRGNVEVELRVVQD
jgi:Ohr subfamily peroxiredoxin